VSTALVGGGGGPFGRFAATGAATGFSTTGAAFVGTVATAFFGTRGTGTTGELPKPASPFGGTGFEGTGAGFGGFGGGCGFGGGGFLTSTGASSSLSSTSFGQPSKLGVTFPVNFPPPPRTNACAIGEPCAWPCLVLVL
jgi:hypothetical protein